MSFIVGADGGQDECRRVGRGVLLADDNELVEREKIGRKLRASAAVLSFEKIVRERFGN